MLSTVRQYAPTSWNSEQRNEVSSHSEEYKQLEYEVRRAFDGHDFPTIRRMIRVQDIHSYGQFLIREQLLINSSANALYRVRRYLQVSRNHLEDVIRYNLDPRRCGMGQSLTFYKNLSYFNSGNLIVVVKMLTESPNQSQLSPKTSCDYFIEYIIEP